MYQYIDKYCERVSPDFWGEPLNTLSNLAFLVAGILLLRLILHQKNHFSEKSWDILVLIALLFIITLGSSFWHIFAQKWSLYSDALPILFFMNLFILSCLYRLVKRSAILVASLFLLYHVFNFGLQQYFEKDFMNGSIFYLPTLIFLLTLSLYLKPYHVKLSRQILLVSCVFTVALFFRTIDINICQNFPFGSHFIWHIISAYMMYKLLKILILASQSDLNQFKPQPKP